MIDVQEFAQMSVDDRIELVEMIWDSIAIDSRELAVPPTQREELLRRLAMFDASPVPGSSWKDVRRRIESQL